MTGLRRRIDAFHLVFAVTAVVCFVGCDGLFEDLDDLERPQPQVECNPEHDDEFGGGSGDADSPYLLCTAAHFDEIRDHSDYMDARFLVAEDIDFDAAGAIAPIGSEERGFAGYFDGNGHDLTNFELDSGEGPRGLFSRVASEGEVVDMNLAEVDIESVAAVGGMVGLNEGTIRDSRVSGDVDGLLAIGGLVGINEGTIADVEVNVRTHGGTWVGGIAGINEGLVESSRSEHELTADGRLDSGELPHEHEWQEALNTRIVGGAVGMNSGVVDGIAVRGSVTSDGELVLQDDGLEATGGLVGLNTGEIDSSVVDRPVSAEGEIDRDDHTLLVAVGGLCGLNAGRVEESASSGAVEVDVDIEARFGNTGDINWNEILTAGGFSGINQGRFENTYSTAPVTIDSDSGFDGLEAAGGAVGSNSSDGEFSSVDNEIITSYASGQVQGGLNIPFDTGGGFVGHSDDDDPPPVTDSYWDEDTANQDSDDSMAERRSTTQFGTQDSFSSTWDFDDVWVIDEAPDGVDRPVLRWE